MTRRDDDKPLTGSCLCGGVRFEIRGPFLRASHCHCSRCRKHSGAGASTQGRVLPGQLRVVTGKDLVRTFKAAPDAAVKAFCTVCGSSLFGGGYPGGPEIAVRFGALDGDPGMRPQFRMWVDSMASWDAITDDLPQYAEGWSPAAKPKPRRS
jgi:hypothetical protein